MKKLFIFFLIAGLVTACNNNNPFSKRVSNADKTDKEKKDDGEKKDDNVNGGYDDRDKDYGKSNWTTDRRNYWMDKCMDEYSDEPGGKRICSCILGKMEQAYPDERDVRDAIEKETDRIIKQCEDGVTGGENENNNDNEGYIRKTDSKDEITGDDYGGSTWTTLQREQYIRNCESTAGSAGGYSAKQVNAYCDCMTRKVERKYSFGDAQKLTTTDFQTREWKDAAAECMPRY